MKSDSQNKIIVVWGAGEMASGVIHLLFKSGYKVIALEQPKPVCVRRLVCFANAVYENKFSVEGVSSIFVNNIDEALVAVENNIIPIVIDSEFHTIKLTNPIAVIDCRMLKKNSQSNMNLAPFVIGLGPGFEAGIDCHVVIETNRGLSLGKIIYRGKAEEYTGVPAEVNSYTHERVLRSPADGKFITDAQIGDVVKVNHEIGKVNNIKVVSQIDGIIRGLIHETVKVKLGQKIGDIDPSGNIDTCFKISDKASTIADGVLEALKNFKC